MAYLSWQIVRQRALAAKRDWSSRTVYAVAIGAGSVLFCVILVGTYFGANALADAHAWRLLWSIPAWAFLVYLFTDIFIAFGQALGDLYLAADMPGLLTMPLRTSSIVVAKFVGGVVQNEIYVAAFLLPFVLGYLFGTHAGFWTYPIAIVGTAVFPAMLYAVLAAVTILALRYIPSHQAKEALGCWARSSQRCSGSPAFRASRAPTGILRRCSCRRRPSGYQARGSAMSSPPSSWGGRMWR